jgi:hypothetical protein
MASLKDYVAQQFPEHRIDVFEPNQPTDHELTEHTVVSYVIGSRAGIDLLTTYRRAAAQAPVAALAVRPSDPTLVPTNGEDRDGVMDLSVRRVAAFVVTGALILGAAGAGLAFAFTDSGITPVIVGVFAALVGAIVGAIVGGGRFAGERANSQPRAPGREITVVAAFLDDDATARSVARMVGPAAEYEVRIVDHQGGWRSPGAGAA